MFSHTTPRFSVKFYEKLSQKRIITPVIKALFIGQESATKLRAIKNRLRGFYSALSGSADKAQQKIPAQKNFIPFFCFVARPGTFSEISLEWNDRATSHCAQNILADYPIEFRYCPPVAGILGLSLNFGTHNRVNSCSLEIAVYNEEMALLASCSASATALLDNKHSFFSFDSIIQTANRPLLIRISSKDAEPSNCVALWGVLLDQVHQTEVTTQPIDLIARENKKTISHVVTPFIDAPRKESFFPRYTASCNPNILAENVIGWEGRCFETKYQAIYLSSEAKISFESPHSRLSKIVMTLVTFGRINQCTVVLELSRIAQKQRTLCFRKTIKAISVADCAPYELTFDPIEESQAAWFELVISSPDGNHENCIGIVGTVVINELSIARNLIRMGSMPSMVDLRKTLTNLTNLCSTTIPVWEKVLRDPHRDNFLIGIIYDLNSLRVDLSGLENDARVRLIAIAEAENSISQMVDFSMIVFVGETPFVGVIETILEVSRHLCIPSFSWGYPILQNSRCKDFSPTLTINEQREMFQTDLSEDMRNICDYILESLITENKADKDSHRINSNDLIGCFNTIIPTYRKQRLPKISLISILYKKENEIEAVLESIRQQDYPGEIEIIFVDDCSPDASTSVVQEVSAKFPEVFSKQGRMPISILKNEQNLGNCGSRNRALAASSGDIALIIDADCVLNKRCLSAHASGHSIGDVDVVIGTHNLESNHQEPEELLARLEKDLSKTVAQAQLQDPTVLPSFLNSITRNISIRIEMARDELFDELFSYSTSPDSGFGWEDVEMGYRLFKRGARFRFMREAISVHISHPSSCAEDTKPLRSIKNFRRLIEKHPELRTVARRWVVETFSKICTWMDNSQQDFSNNPDRQWVSHILKGSASFLENYQPRKRLKILTFRWHCPHQYELYKLPHDFTLLTFPDDDFTNSWGFEQRPLRPNATFKPVHDIDPQEFDLVILHFDENSLFPENSNGVLGRTWGRTFRWLRENTQIPSIAVCHGTPQFEGQYRQPCRENLQGQTLDYERRALVEYLTNVPVVCNSHQAKAEWGFYNSRVIWHGFDPIEFGPHSVGQGILTLGKMMKERPIYRGYKIFEAVREKLPENVKFSHLSVKRPAYDYPSSGNDFAYAKFRLYNQALRQYSVYFNPTQRSPMPRSRGEAMMSGLVSVSAMNHDVSYFIKNGVDGFFSNDAGELADYLLYLNTHPAKCAEMGHKSRQLASDIFNIDRYHRDWNQLLREIV